VKTPCIIGRGKPNGPWVWTTLTTTKPRKSGTIHVAMPVAELGLALMEFRMAQTVHPNPDEPFELPVGISFVSPEEALDDRQERFCRTIGRAQKRPIWLPIWIRDFPALMSGSVDDLVNALLSGDFFQNIVLRSCNEVIAAITTEVEPGKTWLHCAKVLGITKPWPWWLPDFLHIFSEENVLPIDFGFPPIEEIEDPSGL
jgi:hypothetical protein